jgi:3-phenylpropionate/trans-cinnamate dioxygenase ferredoxin reductase component
LTIAINFNNFHLEKALKGGCHMQNKYQYVIIGSGLAGASAVEGIRSIDSKGSILLISSEKFLPYDRPPLSKKLWFGKKTVEEIFLHDRAYYEANKAELALGVTIKEINCKSYHIVTDKDEKIGYSKLLLATGGVPRKMDIPGGSLDEIVYYRNLDDYNKIRELAQPGKKALIVGGGFIGSEMAAALNFNKIEVTMIFPEDYLVQRIFPEGVGKSVQKNYIDKGVKVLYQDVPVSFEKSDGKVLMKTKANREIKADFIIAGLGILPSVELAKNAGLVLDNGIIVNDKLQTSEPDIYSAGDNTNFKYHALNQRMRVEHWDNSIEQGKTAGMNMAGAEKTYDHMPYFFSDLFEFGYEAVGNLDSRLTTFGDWKKENETGVIYYLQNDIVKGVMLCNVWDKVESARILIWKQNKVTENELRGAIPF